MNIRELWLQSYGFAFPADFDEKAFNILSNIDWNDAITQSQFFTWSEEICPLIYIGKAFGAEGINLNTRNKQTCGQIVKIVMKHFGYELTEKPKYKINGYFTSGSIYMAKKS